MTRNEKRVLIFAPYGCDGPMAQRVLNKLDVDAQVCDSLVLLCRELEQGVGALLLTEEALWDVEFEKLLVLLDGQPSWSAIPIVIAANVDENLYKHERLLGRLENYKVTFFARPVVVVSLASSLRAALASRHRQYQVRDLMSNLQTELRLRDEFLATLSHELRNPLGAVRNAVQLMSMARIEDPALHESRDIIDRQTRDLSRLLDDLLDVARITQGKIVLKPEVFSLNRLLEEIVRDQRQAGSMHCSIELELPPADIRVKADRLRIKQIFLNLLNNADKFSDKGAVIRITAAEQDKEAAVSVKDQGIGIDGDMLDSVFHLFSQAARTTHDTRGGLGIGLTVVQSLVRMHGGRVTVSSDGEGKGSEFTVYLPWLRSTGRRRRVEREADPAKPGTKQARNVLVVDDDRDGGLSLKALLESDGHTVTVTGDGQSGLLQARALGPDVVILDIGLPDCSGYEVARLLRSDREFSDTLFIALTGYGSERDRRRARESGFDYHLTKPINFGELRSILHDTLARESAAPAETSSVERRLK
ncbi:MAG: ATP-binding protein [Woeseia sp.]